MCIHGIRGNQDYLISILRNNKAKHTMFISISQLLLLDACLSFLALETLEINDVLEIYQTSNFLIFNLIAINQYKAYRVEIMYFKDYNQEILQLLDFFKIMLIHNVL